MKKIIMLVLSVALFGSLAIAAGRPDVEQFDSCGYCGMDREKFAHSRMLVTYEDGSSFASCSIHCAAVDFAVNIDKLPREIQVGDYGSKELIDAEKAQWVIGGDRPGVMSARAKWAFARKADAEQFVKAHGGKPATFEEAMKAAYEDMYNDTRMIRERRKMKRQHMKQ